jgi:DNA polymerase I
MSRRYLVLDVSWLAHRAFHTTGSLSFRGRGTGVIFGFLRDLIKLHKVHKTQEVAFCFDGGYDQRRRMFADYKAHRKPINQEEQEARAVLHEQIDKLREHYLPAIGYRNIFWANGFEADDLIARLCKDVFPTNYELVIVGSDHDLLQLLDTGITLYNPQTEKVMTRNSFMVKWGLPPRQWANVLAIAGCKGDGVPGVRGVGEKTAAQYLRRELKETTKAYQRIEESRWEEVIPLVRLPLPSTPYFTIEEDCVTRRGWEHVFRATGISKLKSPI